MNNIALIYIGIIIGFILVLIMYIWSAISWKIDNIIFNDSINYDDQRKWKSNPWRLHNNLFDDGVLLATIVFVILFVLCSIICDLIIGIIFMITNVQMLYIISIISFIGIAHVGCKFIARIIANKFISKKEI